MAVPLNLVCAAMRVISADSAWYSVSRLARSLVPLEPFCGLHRQFAHALQRVGDGGQRAFGRLRQRDAVVGIADRDVDAADLRVLAVGDGQAGGVVACAELTRRPEDRRCIEVASEDCDMLRLR